jgi:hypothetical protein
VLQGDVRLLAVLDDHACLDRGWETLAHGSSRGSSEIALVKGPEEHALHHDDLRSRISIVLATIGCPTRRPGKSQRAHTDDLAGLEALLR